MLDWIYKWWPLILSTILAVAASVGWLVRRRAYGRENFGVLSYTVDSHHAIVRLSNPAPRTIWLEAIGVDAVVRETGKSRNIRRSYQRNLLPGGEVDFDIHLELYELVGGEQSGLAHCEIKTWMHYVHNSKPCKTGPCNGIVTFKDGTLIHFA